jgi:hypothetical protein
LTSNCGADSGLYVHAFVIRGAQALSQSLHDPALPLEPADMTVIEATSLLFVARKATAKDIADKGMLSDSELLTRLVYAPEFEQRVLVPLSTRAVLPHSVRDLISLPRFSAWYAERLPFEPWEVADLAAAPDWSSFFLTLFDTALFRKAILANGMVGTRVQIVADAIQKIKAVEAHGAVGSLRRQLKVWARTGKARAWQPVSPETRDALRRLFGDIVSPCPGTTVGGVFRQLLRSENFRDVLRRLRDRSFADLPHWRYEPPSRDERQALACIFEALARPDTQEQGRGWLRMLELALDDVGIIASSLDLGALSDLELASAILCRRDPLWTATRSDDRISFHFPGAEECSVEINIIGPHEEMLNETPHIFTNSSEGRITCPDLASTDGAILAVKVGDNAPRLVPIEHQPPTALALESKSQLKLISAAVRGAVVRVDAAGHEPLPGQLFFESRGFVVRLDASPPGEPLQDGRTALRYFGTAPAGWSGSEGKDAAYTIATDVSLSSIIGDGHIELVIDSGDVAFSPPVFEGGHLLGWAFALDGAAYPQRITVTARTTDRHGGISERSITQVLGERSPEAALLFGPSAENSGYRFPLPSYLLDGETYPLCAELSYLSHRRAFVDLHFHATDAFLADQISQVESHKELEALLCTIAEAGRSSVISQFYASPTKLADELAESAHIKILATLVVKRPAAIEDSVIQPAFEACWRWLLADPKQLGNFAATVMQASLSVMGANDVARFPLQPALESIVDLLLMSEKRSTSDADTYGAFIAGMLAFRRVGVARSLAEQATGKHPANPAVLTEIGRLAWALGQSHDAKEHALKALKAKPGFGKAQMLLARVLLEHDRPLDAISIATGGAGLSRAPASPAPYDVAQIAAHLDWHAFYSDSASAAGKSNAAHMVARSIEIYGGIHPAQSFSVFFVGKPPAEQRIYAAFQAYGDLCVIATSLEGDDVSVAPSVTKWAIFMSGDAWSPQLLDNIFRQLRPFELVVRIVVAAKAESVDRPAFKTIGLIAKSEILGAFGQCTLEQFAQAAERRLKVKTILVREQPL